MGIDPLPRIKVCGLRGIEDLPDPFPAALDAVGFVGASRSPRQISAEKAARIVDAIPRRVMPVAVLVEPYPEEAERWLRVAGARAVQLCGYETPEEWIGFPFPILRRIAVDDEAVEEMDAWTNVARGFVLELPATADPLSTDLARVIAARGDCLLSGGLHAGNVAELVRAIRPFGVDASTALEGANLRKDPALVSAFVEAAANALGTRGASR